VHMGLDLKGILFGRNLGCSHGHAGGWTAGIAGPRSGALKLQTENFGFCNASGRPGIAMLNEEDDSSEKTCARRPSGIPCAFENAMK
jgi:hypothetical protein